MSEFAARAKAAWARLIRKVYEADRLSEGATCFPAQCSVAVNQRETVASGQTREKSGIESPSF